MQTTTSIDEQVMDFVAKITSVNREKISPKTTLFGDLGINGDEAEEFLLAYAEHFEVDLTGLNFTDHFGTEGINPFQIPQFLWMLAQSSKGTDPHQIAGMIPITVEDLIRSAAAKKWLMSAH